MRSTRGWTTTGRPGTPILELAASSSWRAGWPSASSSRARASPRARSSPPRRRWRDCATFSTVRRRRFPCWSRRTRSSARSWASSSTAGASPSASAAHRFPRRRSSTSRDPERSWCSRPWSTPRTWARCSGTPWPSAPTPCCSRRVAAIPSAARPSASAPVAPCASPSRRSTSGPTDSRNSVPPAMTSSPSPPTARWISSSSVDHAPSALAWASSSATRDAASATPHAARRRWPSVSPWRRGSIR